CPQAGGLDTSQLAAGRISFIRKYPPHYTYMVAAGLATVLEYLEQVRFSEAALAYLQQTGRFSAAFLDYLSTWRFQGDVRALPEGRFVYRDEPILEVTAPIVEAQLVETFIVNAIHLQTLIATKAARCVQAAQGRRLVDFALRRTHGTDAGLKVARASYLAGFDATSNVLAGQIYGIPISGTMAHAYVSSFTEEIEAFRAFAATYPQHTVLLIDTYDTVHGARRAAVVGREMAQRGEHLLGVRLDSGDMTTLSKQVRAVLDEAGLPDVRIVASGGFDEYGIAHAVQEGGCIDIFWVGTKMGVAADAPYFDMAYKLVKYDGRPIMKLSTGKVTLVDEKQIWRHPVAGQYVADTIALRHEALAAPDTTPLLQQVMRAEQVVGPQPGLREARQHHAAEMAALGAPYKGLRNGVAYPVQWSQELTRLQRQVASALQQQAERVEVMV
ncbi:MAG: nicotinate phosphoribosyltransferase, partial [Candidatus Tectomicrobia bacterium]|nr:nicotinate phosphoribosyltransferase [Candidatus Tectomicrobia bacterium]